MRHIDKVLCQDKLWFVFNVCIYFLSRLFSLLYRSHTFTLPAIGLVTDSEKYWESIFQLSDSLGIVNLCVDKKTNQIMECWTIKSYSASWAKIKITHEGKLLRWNQVTKMHRKMESKTHPGWPDTSLFFYSVFNVQRSSLQPQHAVRYKLLKHFLWSTTYTDNMYGPFLNLSTFRPKKLHVMASTRVVFKFLSRQFLKYLKTLCYEWYCAQHCFLI